VEERQEAAINGRRSQNSERVRAHPYEREFRPKPVRRADGDLSVTHTRVEPRGALDGVMETARLRRTKVTYIWDVSDPLFQSVEPRQEGGRGGRSRPRCRVIAADGRADNGTDGKKRRPFDRSKVACWQGDR
jgi:hypothetical protein